MGWLSRSREEADRAAPSDGVVESETATGPEIHDSPALAEIGQRLAGAGPTRILDLGPALAGNLEHFSAYAGGVRIAHLLRRHESGLPAAMEPADFTALLSQRIPWGEEPYGLVLIWDLLNYLDHEQAVTLSRHLAEVCRPGAMIYASTFTTETMPAEPSGYLLVEGARLAYHPPFAAPIEATNPTPAQIERRLEPFRIHRSILLRHGVREYLAVLEDLNRGWRTG